MIGKSYFSVCVTLPESVLCYTNRLTSLAAARKFIISVLLPDLRRWKLFFSPWLVRFSCIGVRLAEVRATARFSLWSGILGPEADLAPPSAVLYQVRWSASASARLCPALGRAAPWAGRRLPCRLPPSTGQGCPLAPKTPHAPPFHQTPNGTWGVFFADLTVLWRPFSSFLSWSP